MAGSTLEYIYKPETEKELAHSDVVYKGFVVGYIIKNNSSASAINENWNFVWKNCFLAQIPYTKTRKEMHKLLEKVDWSILNAQIPNVIVCAECGSDKIQTKEWVEINTQEIKDSAYISSEDNWCPDCETHSKTTTRKEYEKI